MSNEITCAGQNLLALALRFSKLPAGVVGTVVDGGGEDGEAVVVITGLPSGPQSPRRQIGKQLPDDLWDKHVSHLSIPADNYCTFPKLAALTGCMLFLLQKST